MTTSDRHTTSMRTISGLTDRQFELHVQSHTQEQDLFKHLATLSTGSIVALTAFMQRVLAHPLAHWLVPVALFSFAMSIVGAVIMQRFSVLHVDIEAIDDPVYSARTGGIASILGFGGFMIGISALCLFGLLNL